MSLLPFCGCLLYTAYSNALPVSCFFMLWQFLSFASWLVGISWIVYILGFVSFTHCKYLPLFCWQFINFFFKGKFCWTEIFKLDVIIFIHFWLIVYGFEVLCKLFPTPDKTWFSSSNFILLPFIFMYLIHLVFTFVWCVHLFSLIQSQSSLDL